MEFKFYNPNVDRPESDEEDNSSDPMGDEDEPVPRKPEIVKNGKNGEKIAAFDIDQRVKDGRLALLYRNDDTKPQIWF